MESTTTTVTKPRTGFPNRFPGKCAVCRCNVPVGEGVCVKGARGYDVFCQAAVCEPAAEPEYVRPSRPAMQVTEEGMYVRADGEIFRVVTSGAGRLYAKHVAIDESDPDYVRVAFDYLQGAVYTLTPEMKMTEAEAKAFGARYGFCCVCCTELTDNRSLLAGYGPTCAKNNGWWFPTMTEAKRMLADKELAVA